MINIETSLNKLLKYCEKESFKGYDPYDILNSFINFRIIGKWGLSVAIQFQKINPINIRSFIGIIKDYNPKALGLFIKAYCILYEKTSDKSYLEKAHSLFEIVKKKSTDGFSGYAWGYNFDWASPGSYLKAYTPSVVVTSFIIDGIFHYYKITKNIEAKNIIKSAAEYVSKDIPNYELEQGMIFMYTHLSKNYCYNASLLAVEVLAKADYVDNTINYATKIQKAISFVLSAQKKDGSWYYSFNPDNNSERNQIDFHQGFILISLQNLLELTGFLKEDIYSAIEKGISFYFKKQFNINGRSLWRLPSKWPVDIHNQSQGIITFSRLSYLNYSYLDFSKRIAEWTIENMQDYQGYFYYRKYPLFTNKISYIRWSQAWMLLALSEIL